LIRPYVAVVSDSFRSAFASRVLWVALVAIYLFLLAIAPIGYREVFTTTFRWTDFANGTRMKAMLAQGIVEIQGTSEIAADSDTSEPQSAAAAETPAGRIARNLPEELRQNLRKVAEGQEVRIRLDILADGLNRLYESDDWYDEAIWKSAPRLRELRELESLPADELTEELRKRRARLRIEAALPGVFESRGSRSIAMTYAGWQFPAIFQIEKSQFQLLLNHFVLRVIIDWVLGFAMIFLGILVTASIIPDMLQPGSLHLLLSKPVSRSLLFLSKFVGGCAFVFVCVTQLIIGLWLISGLRLDVWNARLLLCIPVCVFLFSVFYSVSAVAGLKWRSPILSIGLANAFGAGCLIIGMGGAISDGFVIERDRITGLAISGDHIITSTRGGHLRRLDRATNRWADLFPDDTGGSDRVIPPVTLADGVVATARVRGGRMNLFGSGATPLLLVDTTVGGPPSPAIELPAGTRELYPMPDGAILAHNTGELMIASAADIRRSAGDDEGDGQTNEQDDQTNETGGEAPAVKAAPAAGDVLGGWLPKLVKMMGGPSDGFASVLPQGMSLLTPNSVDLAGDASHLFVFSGGKLMRLDRPGPGDAAPTGAAALLAGGDSGTRWKVTATAEATASGRSVWVRCIGDAAVVLLRGDDPPLFFTDRLEPIEADAAIAERIPGLAITSATSCHGAGAVALLAGEGHVWMLAGNADGQITLDRLGGATRGEAMRWEESDGKLWVAHHVDRVSAWQLTGAESTAGWSRRPAVTIRPSIGGWRMVDRFLVTPLRTVTPQTGELGETIATIVSGESSMQLPFAGGGEEAIVQRYNVWRPVLTCGGFVAVMLLLGCVYFARTDF
jgi:hypothetical protein